MRPYSIEAIAIMRDWMLECDFDPDYLEETSDINVIRWCERNADGGIYNGLDLTIY